MGKIFYGTHEDKKMAMRLANHYARNYKRCQCFTPSKENSCSFNEMTKKWTCSAAAHHHEGSCGTWEIHPRRGDEWSIPPIQVFPRPEVPSWPPFPPHVPPMKPDPDKPKPIRTFANYINHEENFDDEKYTDASPDDYAVNFRN